MSREVTVSGRADGGLFVFTMIAATVALAILNAAGVVSLPLWAILLPVLVLVGFVVLGVLSVLAVVLVGYLVDRRNRRRL